MVRNLARRVRPQEQVAELDPADNGSEGGGQDQALIEEVLAAESPQEAIDQLNKQHAEIDQRLAGLRSDAIYADSRIITIDRSIEDMKAQRQQARTERKRINNELAECQKQTRQLRKTGRTILELFEIDRAADEPDLSDTVSVDQDPADSDGQI